MHNYVNYIGLFVYIDQICSFYMGVLPSCLSVHYMLAGCLPCQKRASDTLSQLQMVASHHVGGSGSQIWLSSRCFHPMSHLSRPLP